MNLFFLSYSDESMEGLVNVHVYVYKVLYIIRIVGNKFSSPICIAVFLCLQFSMLVGIPGYDDEVDINILSFWELGN